MKSFLFLVDFPHTSRIVAEDTKALLFRSTLHAIAIKVSLRQKFTLSPIEVFGHNQEQNTLLQFMNLSVYSCLVNSKVIQVVTERAKMLPIKNFIRCFLCNSLKWAKVHDIRIQITWTLMGLFDKNKSKCLSWKLFLIWKSFDFLLVYVL